MNKRKYVSISKQATQPVYLDCNATTPIEPEVREALLGWWSEELGNAGSRTHEYGSRAKSAVQRAREEIAAVIKANANDVIFTSGATESNNLAILGLAAWGEQNDKRHIVSTAIEHKAVLEPLEQLESNGFTISLIKPNANGTVDAQEVLNAVRPDTLLVSIMHANNETGAIQPIEQIATSLKDTDTYFHVDAAQSFGKELGPLCHPRIDLMSVSSHKVYGPVGIGALIARRKGYKRPPLSPLSYGGGQEQGLRPGTLPTPLIIGFGLACKIALRDNTQRITRCKLIRDQVLTAFKPLKTRMHSDPNSTLPHVLNFSIKGVDSEALIVALKELIAISNGSACTSQKYEPSHVLEAMGLPDDAISGAVRLSWCHLTPDINWKPIMEKIGLLT